MRRNESLSVAGSAIRIERLGFTHWGHWTVRRFLSAVVMLILILGCFGCGGTTQIQQPIQHVYPYIDTGNLTTTGLSWPATIVGTTSPYVDIVTITVFYEGSNCNGSTVICEPLIISNITYSGDFYATTTCQYGASMTVGQSCSVTVSFTPTLVGVRTGNLEFFSNATDGTIIIPMSGTGYY